jgi:hypothetical protein
MIGYLFYKYQYTLPLYIIVGTLGYVMSELEDGKRFSEVVKTAKSLGYTEPGIKIYSSDIHQDFYICVAVYHFSVRRKIV